MFSSFKMEPSERMNCWSIKTSFFVTSMPRARRGHVNRKFGIWNVEHARFLKIVGNIENREFSEF